MHSSIVSSEGVSYITSNTVCSIIARNPLAPVFLSNDFLAIVFKASSVNVNFTPSSSNNFSYCFTIAFFGFVKISTNAFSSNDFNATVTGTRPINSGIIPNLTKSCGITSPNNASLFISVLSVISELKPIAF